MLEIYPDWNWWASELFWLTDGVKLLWVSVRTSWSHKSQYEPHHCGFTTDSNSIDVCWREKERTMIKVNHDVLCHTNIKLKTITVQEKRQHISANCLFVCTTCQRVCVCVCLKRMSCDQSSGSCSICDAVCGMGNRESNGKNFSNLVAYWFLLLSFPCPLKVAWQENH